MTYRCAVESGEAGVRTFHGYMIEGSWDGEVLKVRGTNKASRVALAGADHDQDVVVPKSDLTDVSLKDASVLTNGNLCVTTRDGKTYQLHFRRKQQAEFSALAEELRGAPGT